ncbi:hypothetical protein LSTR_LSTR002950 [Laodelphax striatellus]|uniref:Uncharacterized protein n=1 Tax=Laodelphax striatellus TaxID=195883 RepID=A0A482XMS0_LAOST|nr:hypothetical protein LSTR_LSTR002950 [Laodelphax striatellus]
MMGDRLKVEGRFFSLEDLDKQESNSSKRARSEETSPRPHEGENKAFHNRQSTKKGRKFNRNESLDRFFSKSIEKIKERTG